MVKANSAPALKKSLMGERVRDVLSRACLQLSHSSVVDYDEHTFFGRLISGLVILGFGGSKS